jgi:hypothetical protein
MPRERTVLLQFRSSSGLLDSEIELSPLQHEELQKPAVVCVSPLQAQNPRNNGSVLQQIILQVRLNPDLSPEEVVLSENVKKAIMSEDGAGVIRLTILAGVSSEGLGHPSRLTTTGNPMATEDPAKQKMLAEVCDLVEKLTHEKEWYFKQAEEVGTTDL